MTTVATAPVDGNFALGGRGTVRPADRISRELLEEAPEIDVVVVDVALRDFGRADVAPECWRGIASSDWHGADHGGFPATITVSSLILDQVEILVVRNRDPAWPEPEAAVRTG
jgi:hypothetical protein